MVADPEAAVGKYGESFWAMWFHSQGQFQIRLTRSANASCSDDRKQRDAEGLAWLDRQLDRQR
jgi:hypothetical protein